MPFCSHCGQSMNEGVKFCSKCGRPLDSAAVGQPSGYSVNANAPEFLQFAKKVRLRGWIFLGILAIVALAVIIIFTKENLGMIILVWGFVVVVTCLLSLFSGLAAKKSWEGQLIDKRVVIKRQHDQDDHHTTTRHIPTLFFRTNDGKNKKIELGYQAGAFEYYETGCHVRKHSGFPIPEKYEKGSEIICVYCGTIFSRQLNTCPKCKLIALK